ncbi:MAG: aspartate-semialdehyde dehydrogenase [Elusimicrobiota bacterium]
MMREYNVGVAGATGAVGQEMLRQLEERNFPIKSIRLFASALSAGRVLHFRQQNIVVEELTKDSFKGIEIALFSAGSVISKQFAPIAAKAGTFVIDNSSAWRMEAEIPLVVPEVNPQTLAKDKKIIANPNCSTIQMVVALKPLHDFAKIKRIIVATYQSVSGAGGRAMEELHQQAEAYLLGNPIPAPNKFPHQIAFNCIPQIDVFLENGYTKEEIKMVKETQKIMGDNSLKVTATTVRVPVFRSHSEVINIETERKLTPEKARELLKSAPGVVVLDNPSQKLYPMPVGSTGRGEVFVGRIREDDTIANGLNLWVVSDNLLKGAALNAVQIAEYLIQKNFV